MKKIFTLFLFIMAYAGIAQPVLSSAYFPVAGNEAKTNLARRPNIDITPPGPNQSWDYSHIRGNNLFTSTYRPASMAHAAADYPDAELFLSIPPSFERFFKSDENSFDEVGFTSLDPVVQLLSFSIRYNTPYTLYRAPLNYQDSGALKTSFFTTFPFDSLPDTLVQQVPPSFRPDTISVRVFINRVDDVDAWGTLRVPEGSYTVLRQKSIEIRKTRIFTYSAILGWSDQTDLVKNFIPQVPTTPDTTVSYSFFSENHSGPVAVVQMDSANENVASILYGGPAVSTKNVYTKPGISVTPNPSYGKVTFKLNGMKPGRYHLEILNILGKPVWDNYYLISSPKSRIKENFFFLPKGTYLYSLSDVNNKILSIKKLIILKP